MDGMNLQDIQIDIEAVKAQIGTQQTTDISDRIMDDTVVAHKFNQAEFNELTGNSKLVYLIDLTECNGVTQQWLSGLSSMVLCTDISEYNYEEANKGRFEADLPELLPDASLALKVHTQLENKVVFIGYFDSYRAYMLLGNYVRALTGARLYREKNGVLTEIKIGDITGLRVHL